MVKTHTLDTDILVIATAHFSSLGVDELWVDFGTGKDIEFYPVHKLYKKMGEEKAKSLLFFHAFTQLWPGVILCILWEKECMKYLS